jgi:hypothetical protein
VRITDVMMMSKGATEVCRTLNILYRIAQGPRRYYTSPIPTSRLLRDENFHSISSHTMTYIYGRLTQVVEGSEEYR